MKKKPVYRNNKSLWDVTEPVQSSVKTKPPKMYTCRSEKLFTIRNGVIVEITNQDRNLTNSNENKTLEKNHWRDRLTEAEIKEIPRFSSYQKGTPSSVCIFSFIIVNKQVIIFFYI